MFESYHDRCLRRAVDRINQSTIEGSWLADESNSPPNVSIHDASPTPQGPDSAAPGGRDSEGAATTDSVDQAVSGYIETSAGRIWVEGTVLMCGCPTCHAPLSIRLWLMAADCWNCDTSVRLTDEQQRLAADLLKRVHERSAPQAEALPAAPTRTRPDRRQGVGSGLADTGAGALQRGPRPRPKRTSDWLRDTFNSLPAWLISFLLHLALLLILALILLPLSSERDAITLSTVVSPLDKLGGDINLKDPDAREQYDILPDADLDEGAVEARELERAKKDAQQLLDDPQPTVALPELDDVKENLTKQRGNSQILLTRDPRIRNEIVRNSGGTTRTEAAVARGLRWLASVQNHDGSWSLKNYDRHTRRSNRGDVAGTSLALLPFLGAGQTHEFGIYKETVSKGLKWLMDHQEDTGDLRNGITEQAGMYSHGQATIVLVEALAMTGDERFRDPAERALRFIERAQHRNGGWRYRPRQSGDTSVFGWQLMALQSARSSASGLTVDDSTMKLADYYLDLAGKRYRARGFQSVPSGALYRYLPSSDTPSATMTAEAILCRMYLGWRRDDSRIIYAVQWLMNNHLPSADEANVYYWYYATQVMHHFGGKTWTDWNKQMRRVLVDMQLTRGQYPGSWDPDEFRWGRSADRIFVTSLAVCTLEVYYRHLPLFEPIDLE